VLDRGGTVRTFVIDLDGATVRRRVPRRIRLRNLARMAVALDRRRCITAAVRLRFLKAYLAASGEASGSWKDIWRELGRVVAALRHRKERTLPRAA
ncbi:MAG: hypothetical protein ACREIV_06220, partial [Planctomycetaceae bacterium]